MLTLLWVPPQQITAEQLDLLMESWVDAPNFYRKTRLDVLSELLLGNQKLFAVETSKGLGGVFSVSVHVVDQERRMLIDGFNFIGAMWGYSWFITEIKKLAEHWNCQLVETTVFNSRIAKMHQKLGSKVEATTLIMEIENEQQEDKHTAN